MLLGPLAARVQLRPMRDADLPFLLEVYASTRADEVAQTGWPPDRQRDFLAMQFDAQHAHYQQHYPNARFDVVEVDGRPAGRLYVYRGEAETRIVDIALLPDSRGQGIGGALVRALLDEAAAAGRAVSIHVERMNPALRLYRRLGFEVARDEGGIYLLMRWSPPARTD